MKYFDIFSVELTDLLTTILQTFLWPLKITALIYMGITYIIFIIYFLEKIEMPLDCSYLSK